MAGLRVRGAGLLAVCVVAACASAAPRPPATAAGDGVLTLAPGQTSGADVAPLRVRFDRVLNDSRCPADAACIQAGDAVVAITVVAPGSPQRYELHTTGATPVVHDGVTISLAALEPRPASSRAIRPADYRLTLRVRR